MSEDMQGRGSCVKVIESFVNKIGDCPIGVTSHSKQNVTEYPYGFVSDTVIPYGKDSN